MINVVHLKVFYLPLKCNEAGAAKKMKILKHKFIMTVHNGGKGYFPLLTADSGADILCHSLQSMCFNKLLIQTLSCGRWSPDNKKYRHTWFLAFERT